MTDLSDQLSPEHYSEIVVSSVVDPAVAAARGYRTLTGTGPERDELAALGFAPAQVERDDAYPLLLIPMKDASGAVKGHQIKPANPRYLRDRESNEPRPLKYETPKGAMSMVDVPDFTRGKFESEGARLWITEGMKKVDALVSQGAAALGLTGVYNWRSKHATLGDWEDIPLRDRTVFVCFDADAAGNRNVQQAMARLGAWLKSKRARPLYIVVPPEVNGTPTKGVDDYFAAGGDIKDLAALATETAPGAGSKDAGFTDALLVERAVEEALAGKFAWAQGLGWLGWNGRVWAEVSDVEPLEAVRQWGKAQFDAVCAKQAANPAENLTAQVAGWRGVLAKAKIIGLRDLSRGVDGVLQSAKDFDSDPDLLTCLNGTIHLPTGELRPHSPDDLITKSADAAYRPRARHPLFTKALTAIPADLHLWYQDRMGQALTGYPTPDHKLVIGQGSGSNGKSTLSDIFRRTFGGYGVLVSDRALLANNDAHPTELMDFRGARFAVMEETPEARHLNVKRLKDSVGTPTMKARRMRQDPVEFLASHSLFINTNYTPVVVETDHGTWRRLALLPFPYTFRAPGKALAGPLERTGDPDLVYAASDPEVRAAALAWMVEGAVSWYARERRMMEIPGRVDDATRRWRIQTDLVLGFCDDRLIFETSAFTQTTDMLSAFNEWSSERGHKPWNDRTFASRFADHENVRQHNVKQTRRRVGGKVQRGWDGVKLRNDSGPFGNGGEPEPDPQDWVDPQPEPPREYGGCICGSTSPDPRAHTDFCGFDAEEQARARGQKIVRSEPQELNRTISAAAPVAVGFDLETADWDKLFVGGHEGPFVRLAGDIPTAGSIGITTVPELLIQGLNGAETIYGHNILGFDLLALAYHHGADYDALAAKAVDTLPLARLNDPPLSKGMPNGYYGLDATAQRFGHVGKTDDLKALARKHGGFDKIPTDDPEYQAYLEGDLHATKFVYERQRMRLTPDESSPSNAEIAYAQREMKIAAIQNRMTLNGWRVDRAELESRAQAENAKRLDAIEILRDRYGVPTHRPDRFKLKLKRDWPQPWSMADVKMLDGETQEREGFAVRIPGERYDMPWATDAGRAAIIEAFAKAGAKGYPTTAKGVLALGKDALGEETWYCPDRRRTFPGMLKAFGHIPEVRALVETLLQATGARMKYAEILKWTTDRDRVHAWVGEAQGSGRWAMTKPSITNMGARGAAAEERAVLVADPGEILVTCDLSQVDMRAVAGLSQDREYMKLFEPGRDAHMEMAEVYFGERTKEARNRTKAINHGLNYGESASRVAESNGLDQAIVDAAVRARAEAYPRVIEWTDEVRAIAASGQLLDNGFGRMMRANPDRAHTQAPALCGQGAARDIMCESLLRLVELADRCGLNVRPHLRAVVHDEVVLSVPDDMVGEWQQLLKEAFTWEWRGVPILCDLGTPAKSWVDCK